MKLRLVELDQVRDESDEQRGSGAEGGRREGASVHTAVVVGGGIGGLATAISLRCIGWEVTAVERAHASLGELGVGEAVRDASRGQYSGGTRTP